MYIEQLTDIIEHSKQSLRLSNKATILGLDSKVIAMKVAKQMESVNYADLTNWCGALGKHILQGYEQLPIEDPYNHFEKKARKLRIHTGYWIFRALKNEGLLWRVRKNTDKHQWVITETKRGREFIDGILNEVPVGERNICGEPSKFRPLERNGFNDPIAGPLVSRYDVDDIKYWNKASIPLVYNHINKLQQLPFVVNTKVLEVVKEVKKDVNDLWRISKGNVEDADVVEGLTRDEVMALSYAEQMGDDQFWFYWDLCFRGRTYCKSSYLTPQGSKLAKSLLKLGNGKALGSEGYFWLGVHTANTFGKDKLPVEDRFQWFEDNIDMIRRIGKDGIGQQDWMNADDPFGFLAACIEVNDAFNNKGGVYEFVSNLMVGFDATTSGLQILSLLSRDEVTGALCNLTDSDEVGDSYNYIANGVWEDETLDEYWNQHVDKKRSIVKRSVMVKYYKCGKRKMGNHILGDFKHKLDGLDQSKASKLGALIFDKCDEMLPGPKKVMDKLTEIGKADYAKGEDYTIKMPYNGFTIVSKYRANRTETMKLTDGDFRIRVRYIAEPGKYIKKEKVETSTAVNTIHGLDAQLVSWLVNNTEYDMCPIHDCFSAVAADAGKLYEDARYSMYHLFKDFTMKDILEQKEYGNEIEDIKYGKLNVEHILENQYCIS